MFKTRLKITNSFAPWSDKDNSKQKYVGVFLSGGFEGNETWKIGDIKLYFRPTIKDNYYEGRIRYSVANSQIQKISSIDNMRLIRGEIKKIIEEFKFNSILEVGVGELTTLESIYSNFGPDIDCYGVDLSLNRIYHGLHEYKKHHDTLPNVVKANAVKLP